MHNRHRSLLTTISMLDTPSCEQRHSRRLRRVRPLQRSEHLEPLTTLLQRALLPPPLPHQQLERRTRRLRPRTSIREQRYLVR
jgi:hypothetical protein